MCDVDSDLKVKEGIFSHSHITILFNIQDWNQSSLQRRLII